MKKLKYLILIWLIIVLIETNSYATFNIETPKKVTNETNTQTNINTNTTTDTEELKAKSDELKSQISEENKNLEDVKSQITDQLAKIDELEEKINQSQIEIDKVDIEIYKYEKQIEEIQEKIDVNQEDLTELENLLDERLVFLYEQGELTYLDVLLNSKNPIEFVTNYYLVKEMANSDLELMSEVKQNIENIEENKEILLEKQDQLAEIKKDFLVSETVIKNTKVTVQKLINELSASEKSIQEKLSLYNSEFAEVNKQLLQNAKDGIGTVYVGGDFAWPVPGYSLITSPYGYRVHPVTKVYSLHTGTDISAPTGTDFIAANDGVVTKACYNYAYGNMVVIDHGGGISTLYAHGSEILVKEGEYVTKNTPVLKVGSTGYSTGPHAHFEVRIDGICTDPMPYITSNFELTNN